MDEKDSIYKVSRSVSVEELQRLCHLKALREAKMDLEETIYEMNRKHEAELGKGFEADQREG